MEKIFKAKRLDNGEWRILNLGEKVFLGEGEVGSKVGMYWIDKNTICQYTGIKDSEGNRIFEGDILAEDKVNPNADKDIVSWHEDGHWMCKYDDGSGCWGDYLEAYSSWFVIGNIHDKEGE